MNINDKGTMVATKLIGRGNFSTVWQSQINPDDVYIKTITSIDEETVDYAKVTLEHINRFRSPNVHIPPMEKLEEIYTRKHGSEFEYTIFKTRYSRKLTPKDKEQWHLFNQIVMVEHNIWDNYPESEKKEGWTQFNYAQDVIDELNGNVPDTIIEALDGIYTWGESHSGDLKFDFSNTNFRIYNNHLMFVDPVFNPFTFEKHILQKRGEYAAPNQHRYSRGY